MVADRKKNQSGRSLLIRVNISCVREDDLKNFGLSNRKSNLLRYSRQWKLGMGLEEEPELNFGRLKFEVY